MPHLSVIIITKNEAEDIRACLESVAWADEIVIVDAGSEDDTVALCRQFTGKVYVTAHWPGFGPQKNFALAQATGEWVLALDADERVTPELRAEMTQAMQRADHAVYSLPRLSSYCGRFIRHSGWWPDHVPRLFQRGRARFSDDLVHERLLFDGVAGRLQAPLLHHSFKNLEEVLDKVNRYSSAAAAMQQARGRHGSLSRAVASGLWAFFRTYFLKAGFLDGREGFMLAVSNAEGTYYRYLKLLYLQSGNGAGKP